MPGDGHRGPKNNGKKAEENKDQRDWMRDDFDQPASSTEKNCCGAETEEQTKFGANEGAKILHVFSTTVPGHERDHIHCAEVVQSADGLTQVLAARRICSPTPTAACRTRGIK